MLKISSSACSNIQKCQAYFLNCSNKFYFWCSPTFFNIISSNITYKVSHKEWDFRGTVENIYYMFPNIHDSL